MKLDRSLLDTNTGRTEYVRVDETVCRPGSMLAARTLNISRGGSVDVLTPSHGSMGPGLCTYTPGLKAWRKNLGDSCLYRFAVPPNAPVGTSYTISATGDGGFNFFIRAI